MDERVETARINARLTLETFEDAELVVELLVDVRTDVAAQQDAQYV